MLRRTLKGLTQYSQCARCRVSVKVGGLRMKTNFAVPVRGERELWQEVYQKALSTGQSKAIAKELADTAQACYHRLVQGASGRSEADVH